MKISLEKITIVLIFFYLIIDSVNGVILRNYNFSVSPIYKSLILVLMLWLLFKQNKFTPFVIVFVFILLHLIHIMKGSFSLIGLFWSIKFITIVVSFHFFKQLIIKNKYKIINNLFTIGFLFIFINVLIGLFGYGYAQYARHNIGTRGLFFAGNELGILLIIIIMFLLIHYLVEKNIKKYLLVSFSALFLSAMLTTKVALIGSSIIIFVLPMISIWITRKGLIVEKKYLYANLFGIVIFFIFVPYTIYFALYKMNLILRILATLNSFDLITLLFSGRNLSAEKITEYVYVNASIVGLTFGYGYNTILKVVGKSVEIDIIDNFMLFGFVGSIIIYGFFIAQLIMLKKLQRNLYPYSKHVIFGIIMIMIISITSGHVVNSGLAGIFIGAFMAMGYYKNYSIDEKV